MNSTLNKGLFVMRFPQNQEEIDMADYNYNDRRSYNNVPLKEGQAMVPIYITWEMVKYYHMDPDNLETWNIKGHKVLVAFDIVKEEDKSNAIKVFWKDVRDYMKQDKPDSMLCSYEELTEATADDHYSENKSYEPQETPSLERTVLLQQIIDELIEEVRAIDPECGSILDLIREGKENKDIITYLGYGTSHGYARIKDANTKAKELYYKD